MQRHPCLAALLVFVGCADSGKMRELESRLVKLEAERLEIEQRTTLIEARADVTGLRLLRLEENEEANVSCTENGYSFIPTQLGKFLLSCADLRPFGDGYKVVLRIGNPHYVAVSGFRLVIRYGQRMPSGNGESAPSANWEKRQRSIREKAVDLPSTLRPAAWNRVEVVLAPAKAEDVGFIGIKMSVDRLTLY